MGPDVCLKKKTLMTLLCVVKRARTPYEEPCFVGFMSGSLCLFLLGSLAVLLCVCVCVCVCACVCVCVCVCGNMQQGLLFAIPPVFMRVCV